MVTDTTLECSILSDYDESDMRTRGRSLDSGVCSDGNYGTLIKLGPFDASHTVCWRLTPSPVSLGADEFCSFDDRHSASRDDHSFVNSWLRWRAVIGKVDENTNYHRLSAVDSTPVRNDQRTSSALWDLSSLPLPSRRRDCVAQSVVIVQNRAVAAWRYFVPTRRTDQICRRYGADSSQIRADSCVVVVSTWANVDFTVHYGEQQGIICIYRNRRCEFTEQELYIRHFNLMTFSSSSSFFSVCSSIQMSEVQTFYICGSGGVVGKYNEKGVCWGHVVGEARDGSDV